MKSVRCCGAGEKVLRHKKPRQNKRGKETVSETENNLIPGIPPVVRLGPIVVQPKLILIAINIEDVQIAVSVSKV